MKKIILSKGKILSKTDQKSIHGGASSSGGVVSSDRRKCITSDDCRGNRICKLERCRSNRRK